MLRKRQAMGKWQGKVSFVVRSDRRPVGQVRNAVWVGKQAHQGENEEQSDV